MIRLVTVALIIIFGSPAVAETSVRCIPLPIGQIARDPIEAVSVSLLIDGWHIRHIAKSGATYDRERQYDLRDTTTPDGQSWRGEHRGDRNRSMRGTIFRLYDRKFYKETAFSARLGGAVVDETLSDCGPASTAADSISASTPSSAPAVAVLTNATKCREVTDRTMRLDCYDRAIGEQVFATPTGQSAVPKGTTQPPSSDGATSDPGELPSQGCPDYLATKYAKAGFMTRLAVLGEISKCSHSSVLSLDVFIRAVKDTTGDEDAARDALQSVIGFSRTIVENPDKTAACFAALSIWYKDTRGKWRDSVELMKDFIKTVSEADTAQLASNLPLCGGLRAARGRAN